MNTHYDLECALTSSCAYQKPNQRLQMWCRLVAYSFTDRMFVCPWPCAASFSANLLVSKVVSDMTMASVICGTHNPCMHNAVGNTTRCNCNTQQRSCERLATLLAEEDVCMQCCNAALPIQKPASNAASAPCHRRALMAQAPAPPAAALARGQTRCLAPRRAACASL